MSLPPRRVATALAFVAFALPATAAEVGRIRAHLFYEESGRLSQDILAGDFAAFNAPAGGGSAEEQASDVVVAVEVRTTDESAEPLRIVVRDERGRILARRRSAGPFYSRTGSVWKTVWLEDAGCAGPLTVTATIGRSVGTERILLACGE